MLQQWYLISSEEKLTMLLMKLSLIITCLIFFQSLVSSPSIRQIDSKASLTAAGGFVMARTSTRCCRLIELTAGEGRGTGFVFFVFFKDRAEGHRGKDRKKEGVVEKSWTERQRERERERRNFS